MVKHNTKTLCVFKLNIYGTFESKNVLFVVKTNEGKIHEGNGT